MTVETLAAWILGIMLSAVPPGKTRHPESARETQEAGEERYAAIARALAGVVLDDEEKPLFDGDDARARTALLMLAISLHESHWRRDVDLGIGRKGRYWCMMQIAVPGGETPEGWRAEELVQSRDKCFRRALHILQRGRKFCRGEDDPYAFVNHYASGYCDRGQKAVAKRIRTMNRWRERHPLAEK